MRKPLTSALAARLVAAQFPQWAHLPVVPVVPDGWDNTTFRLGDELSVRLPNEDAYAPQVAKEQQWLRFLAPQLSVRIPEPVAWGEPTEEFPRPWSVFRWIDGTTAAAEPPEDLSGFAGAVAGFLRDFHAIDPSGGPPPGPHCFFRGGSLAVYDAETRSLAEDLPPAERKAALDTWEAALATTWQQDPVWVHGDLAPSNLIVAGGNLRAVIDFGGCAIGDPACDLVMAWTFFDGASREVFREGVDLDEATWQRARGWALWKALVTGGEPRGLCT